MTNGLGKENEGLCDGVQVYEIRKSFNACGGPKVGPELTGVASALPTGGPDTTSSQRLMLNDSQAVVLLLAGDRNWSVSWASEANTLPLGGLSSWFINFTNFTMSLLFGDDEVVERFD